MSLAYSFSRFLPWLSLLIALTLPLPGTAADLTPDKSRILIGETVYVKLDARLVLNAKWSASDELQILASDSKGATVKGKAPGQATLNVKWLGGKKSTRITVFDPSLTTQGADAPSVAKPGADESDTGDQGMAGTDVEDNPYLTRLRGLSSFKQYPKGIQIAQMLLAFKNGDMDQDAALKFYQNLADNRLTMFDVIQTKTHLNNAGMGEHFLGTVFREAGSPVEMALLAYRRQVTVEGIRHVVEQFKGRHGNHAVFLAEIGKWARQADRALTFSGDIDFSFVSNDTNLTWLMKQAFDTYIKTRTGLESTAFDSVCTAHGRATPDVYIGDHGKMYGDAAMQGGLLKRIDLQTGRIADQGQSGNPIILHMLLEQQAARRQAGLPELKAHLEPGLSMEMVRHFNHDIVAPKLFDPIDSILKASKYMDRSNAALKDIPGASPASAQLAEFTQEITKAAQTSDWNRIAELIKGHFIDAWGSDGLKFTPSPDGGRMTADLQTNEAVIEAFFKRCTDAMWSNVRAGFEYKIKDLNTKIWNADQKKLSLQELQDLRAEMKQIVEMIKIELLAAEQNHLTVPDEIIKLNERLNAMVEDFLKKQGARSLSEAEMKELEFIKELVDAKTPSMRAKAMAFIVDRASKTIDKTNNILDLLDDTLLNDLRGQNPEFGDFVDSVKSVRADVPPGAWGQAANAHLNKAKLAVMQTRGYQLVQKSNMTLNQVLNKTAARRGAVKIMTGVNLVQELPAYYEAWNREGYAGLATEFFRRRVPGGSAMEAYYQDNYLRMGVEVVYAIFPPLAIPEGLYGMASQSAGWAGGKMQGWRYDAMVEELFKGAQFDKQGKAYVISGIRFRCTDDRQISLTTREDILSLPERCPRVYAIILPQIQDHPVLTGMQDILKRPSVSSGPTGAFPYTYNTSGSKYGKQLVDLYRSKVDDVVLEYFKGVVDTLEDAKKWAVGSGYAEIIRIERELGCTQSLASYTVGALGGEDILGDAARFTKIVEDYEALKGANKSVLESRDAWQYDQPVDQVRSLPGGGEYRWGKDYLPECSAQSIDQKALLAKEDAAAYKRAIQSAASEVDKIIGQDYCQKQSGDLALCQRRMYAPATVGALCQAYYQKRNRFIHEDCQTSYKQALKDLEGLRSDLRIVALEGTAGACVGRPSELSLSLDRDCPDCKVSWTIPDYATERVRPSGKLTAVWQPRFAGKTTLRVSVTPPGEAVAPLVQDTPVDVLTEEHCPRLSLVIRSERNELEENEQLSLLAEPLSPDSMRDEVKQYVWSEDGVRMPASQGRSHTFSGQGRRGQNVVVGVKAQTALGWSEIASLTLRIKDSLSDSLNLSIQPAEKNVLKTGERPSFSTNVIRRADSGLLRYQWQVFVNGLAVTPMENNRAESYRLPALDLKENDQVKLVVYVQDTDNNPKSRTYGRLLREGQAEKSLVVHPSGDLQIGLTPTPPSITDGESLKVCVETPAEGFNTPGQPFSYQWQVWEARGWRGNTTSRCGNAPGTGLAGQTIKLKVRVTDSYGRSAERETSLVKVVEEAAYQVTVIRQGSGTVEVGVPVSLSAKSTSGLRALPGMRIEWRIDGHVLSQGDSIHFQADRPGEYRLEAIAIAPINGQEMEVARDQTTLVYQAAETDKPIDDTLGGRDYTSPPVDPVDTYAPTCSHEYSEWSSCNRDTKKQTRRVTGKTPANCEERQKPVIEQSCTPPPTEAEIKFKYLNCLCRCSSGWASHIGVWYDPEGKSKPECESTGPCFGGAGAFGCTRRHYFGAESDCAKNCWAAYYGKDSYDAAKADKLRKDENKKYKKPLIVKLKASKNPADFGDIVDLTAEASEGSGGYRYDWGGCAQDAKDASAKVTNTRQCKPCTANVTVTDQDGDAASDSLLVQCTVLKVKLTKERPADNAIPVGGKAELFAQVLSGDKPASGSFTYHWEPNPDVQYGRDPKNPAYETSGGSQARNTVMFRQLGRTPVWVSVLKQVGKTKMTMGESEQIIIDVISPKLTLKADKAKPVVGEQVVITVEENPKMGDDLISFWWEYKGDVNNPGVHPNTPNSRSWSYKPKNDRPVTITVHAKSKDNGDKLDTASISIAAQKAQVTVTGPRIAGPAPMIWKEGVGLVAAERQVSEHQRVEFSATVSPSAGDLRYQWRAEPSGCSIHSPSSKDTGVTCSSTGSYALTVTVKNADGAELGSGTGNLSVSISQAQIKQGQQKAEASKTLDQAKQAWSAKGFDRAVSLAEEAARTDPAMAQPTLNQFSQGLKQQGWDALNKGERATAIDKLEKAVRLNPNDADARKKLADARDHVAKWPQVEVKVREFDDQIRNKRIWSAQATMLAMQDILRTMAAGQSSNNPTWRKVQDDFNTGIAEYNRFSQEKTARHTQYFKEKNYAAMLANAESMRERELSPADEKECQSRIDFAKLNLQGGQNDGGVSGGGIHSVNSLGNSWDKLSAVGGNFDRFARFDGRGLSVDVPAGNSWGKTGLMAKQPMVKLGKTPVTVTVAVDPARTSGFVVAFAATRHPDVALTNNAWMSWVRNDKGTGDLWIGNVQDAWAGRNKGVSAPTSGQAPTPFVLTLEPGRMTVRAAGQAPVSVEIGWLKEGVDLYPHLFTHPTEAGKAASLALTGFTVGAGGSSVGPDVVPAGQASLRLAQTRFVQGEPIQVHFTAPATWPRDAWVGIIPSTVSHGSEAENDRHDVTYQYLEKRSSGTLTFSAPAPGNWDFRLHDTDSKGKEYASVSFQSVAKGQEVIESTPPQPPIVTANAKLVLEDDLGPYKWAERTEVQTAKVRSGRAAFRSTGNNHFTHRLGLAGNYPGMYRYLDLWLWFDKPGADIQIQVQVDGTWGKRWGFEAGPKYDGYGWTMEGTTVNQPTGRWVNVRLDLIEQLKIHAGQAITGLAFSSDHGDVFYDTVQLLPSSNPLAMPVVRPDGKRVLEDDVGPYKWVEATQVQKEVVVNGQAAFRSTGNNHFTADLGLVGDYANQFRSLSFWVFLIGPEADIQLQVQVDGTWGKRWGYEAGPKYNGYGWTMEGSTANLRHGVWQELKIDLIRDLKINPGQRITGLGFSSDNGDVYYDAVYLQANPNPVERPNTAPTGKRVLEDDLGPYKWVEITQVQREVVAHGQAAFRSTGNNHFTGDLGRVGDYPELFRTLSFWAYFMGPGADIQLQVQVDGTWGKRWGYEAGPKYDGYGWAMEGTTVNLRPGVWQEIKIDLIRDLKINPGQKITGLGFSSDNGDVYYDAVYLQPNPNPAQKPSFQPTGKQVLEDNLGPYKWVERTELQDYLVFRGSKAYRSTGNNHFTAALGVAGNTAGRFQSVGFWAFFMGPEADIQLQVQVNGTWGKRWGFDAGPKYNGYGWAMQGSTANLPNGRWTWIQVDLLNQLKLKAGDKITGLAFSSDNGDVIYDSVWLLPSGARPDIGTGGEAGPIGDATSALPPVYDPPGGRDYTFEGGGAGSNPGGAIGGGGLGGLSGMWAINANSYGGRLWLNNDGSWVNLHNRQENLEAVNSDGRTLTFTRPISGATQRYTGTRSGNRIEGTFTQQGSSTVYKWFATLIDEGRTDVIPVTRFDPVKLVDAVPQANSSAFKKNLRSDLVVNTRSYDRTPYFMTTPSDHQLDLSRVDRACLAGDARGNAGFSVDNFILFEVFETDGRFIKAATVGGHEGLTRNGQTVSELASGFNHNACAVDLRNFLPSGRPFRLKTSAIDYGGVGSSSDVWLVIAGEGRITDTHPGGRDYTEQPSPAAASQAGQVIFEIGNIGGVQNKPTGSASQFTLNQPHVITQIQTYHWNNGRGATPGRIMLKDRSGKTIGDWQASGHLGQGGVPNAYWRVQPNITLPAGTYRVTDTDPATWAHNSQSGNRGFIRIEGYSADKLPDGDGILDKVDSGFRKVDDTLNSINKLLDIFK